MLMISSEDHVEPMRRLVDAVHAAIGKIVVQINHAGGQDLFCRDGDADRRPLSHTRHLRGRDASGS